MKYSYSYIISIQFLGFRFHGWQKQLNAKTLHEAVDKTLFFVLGHKDFKTIGVGRTDAKVSSNNYLLQLFIDDKIENVHFVPSFNSNAPQDIRILSIKEINTEFNIIQAPKIKEYIYLFSFGEKNHPFVASLLVGLEENLNVELMKKGARLFEGDHYFHKYCTKPSENTIFKRTILSCKIVENVIYTANFFPKKSYVLKVKGKGFLRYQIRLMMGILFRLGKDEITLEFIEDSLKENNDRESLKTIAPASGLQLYNVEFIK